MRRKLLLASLFCLHNMLAQENVGPNGVVRCATNEYEQELRARFPNRQSTDDFEKWLSPIVEKVKKDRESASGERAVSRIIRIPVVVHVIHNGDAVGSGENISDLQVQSQITVLNNDFRRKLGTPGHNTHPDGADLEIEFVLAKRNPQGQSSNGINRVQVSNSQFTNKAEIESMKTQTFWDTNQYLNMWVVRIGGGTSQWNGTLGYAQFPQASNLIGVYGGDGANLSKTDGLVMRFGAFGSKNVHPGGTYDQGYDEGRTTTHEIGHWVGLRHIWGDGDCTKDDFCTDTPNAGAPNYSCNQVDSCPASPGNDMIQNYMDYTNDACMNIFTKQQRDRVIAVMYNGLRRKELLSSPALIPLNLAVEGNLAIENIGWDGCSRTMNPVVKLTNYGTNTITSAQILFDFDQTNTRTFNWSGNLTPNRSVLINLPSMFLANNSQTFYASLERVNNVVDGYLLNNEVGRVVLAPTAVVGNNVTFEFLPDSYGKENNWQLRNDANAVVQQSPIYNNEVNPVLKTYNWNLPNGCYTLTFNDTQGDGLINSGYYRLKGNNGTTIFEGGGLKNQAVHKFAINQLGLENVEFKEFSLYPNPNKGAFKINLQSDAEKINVRVYDLSGRAIFNKDFENSTVFEKEIELSNTLKGVYLVTISDETHKTTRKIIIE